ncbi:MAG: glycoside hydrolase family 2 TIM barrel-domain containing protein [Phycisphaeraceae bacterium]
MTTLSDLIDQQLATTEASDTDIANRTTTLTPSRFVPILSDPDRVLPLDGEWRVARWPFEVDEAKLAAPPANDTQWETVQQPGKVFYADPEAEEIDHEMPDWDRITLTHIDENDGAVLRRRVTIPAAWAGKRILLRFQAIFPAGRVYVNGTLLADHRSGLTPVEVDATDHVTPGEEAVVAVRLIRRHKYVQMDMVRHAVEFAGIAQSPCLHAVEPCAMTENALRVELHESLDTGRIHGPVTLRNAGNAPAEATLRLRLLDGDQRQVIEQSQSVTVPAAGEQDADFDATVSRPALWNDEFPNLYNVELELTAPGQPRQTLRYRTGFRRLDLSPDGPKLNGNPVKFRGVNHLTYHPQHGMHTPREWLRRSLDLMKKANVNAIRTHFLGDHQLADLCDEMGIYLVQELPVDWGTHYIHDPEWVGPALTRLEGGVRRDRHHPSLMVWSVGNENMPETAEVAEQGWEHMRLYDRFVKTLDPTRPTMFPPPGPANKIRGIFEVRVGDIADTHYSFAHAKEFLEKGEIENPRSWEADMEVTTRDEALERGWSGVWFSSEYGITNLIPDLLNSPYVSVIDDVKEDPISGKNTQQTFIDRLHREWGYMRSEPSCLGGAYFPWICPGAGKGEEGNPWGWVRWAEDADWGVMTADLTPKAEFWALRTLFSPVWLPPRMTWREGQEELRFEVTNQFNQLDLADCTLRTQMAGGGGWLGQMRKFKDVPVACPPGETREITIPLWNPQTRKALGKGAPTACRCTLLKPDGYRVVTHDILIVPERIGGREAEHMPVGPDAKL